MSLLTPRSLQEDLHFTLDHHLVPHTQSRSGTERAGQNFISTADPRDRRPFTVQKTRASHLISGHKTDQMAFCVTSQPLPFALEREKHIERLFRALNRQIRPTSGPDADAQTKTLAKLTALRSVTRLHITARPQLQGPQCVSRRTYSISTETRDHLFVAVEESSCVCMQCCGPARACALQGFDKDKECVFLFERPLRAEMCCLGCCLMEIRAFTPERELIGTVQQRWSMFTPFLEVCDSDGVSVVRIQGSCCNSRCLSDQELQVVSAIGESIGRIWKRWPGYNEECNVDHEYFGLDVPVEMNVNTKVLLLAAAFLLNHMFFEMS